MYRDYREKGVEFFYVYKSVEHPEINNFISAFNIEERLLHVAEAKRRLKTEIPWICDTMENDMKKTLGAAPNGEYVLDPEGKIIRKRFWSNPETLRADLVELVGKVDKITQVEDLDTTFVVEEREIASGVVPRLTLPRGLRALAIKPVPDDENPFFVKLRVETTRQLAAGGKGQMYLGLYLDPLYKVHWNNRAGKATIELEAPEGYKLSKTKLTSPDVKEDADIDPRQFLIDIEVVRSDDELKAEADAEADAEANAEADADAEAEGQNLERPEVALPEAPIKATVTYTVCDDAETFCIEIKQQYEIPIRATRNLGSRPGTFMPAMFADMKKMDKNGDGNLTKDELPPGEVSLYVGHIDYNGNGIIEADEIEKFLKMFNNGRGFDSRFNDGQEAAEKRMKEKAAAEKAEKDKADKDKADKDKADKDKAEKDKAEKDKAEKDAEDKDDGLAQRRKGAKVKGAEA